VASRPRTKNHAAYLRARQLERAGERERAVQAYLAIHVEDPEGEYSSRCVYYVGRMAFEDDDLEGGLRRMRQVIEEYPHMGLAPQAVRRTVQQLQEHRDDDAAIAFLSDAEVRMRGTDVADTILFRWAMIEQERGNWQEALRIYDSLGEQYEYPESTVWDDAMWEAGQLATEHGEHQRALRYLEAIVSWVESSIATGSYAMDWTDDAQLLIGRIHLEELDDADAAIRAFEALAELPDSTLADDGLLWAARTHFAQNETGRGCRSLRRLLRDFPYSNKQRQARVAARENQCPGAE
jgi:TolA-binding protein